MSMRMKKGMLAGLLALATGGAASPVLAADQTPQGADSACGAQPVLPDELSGWATPAPAVTAANVTGLESVSLVHGRAMMARLHPAGDIKYVLPPAHANAPDSTGGMVVFQAPVAGTYRIMLGQKAWLEVVRGGETTASVHHQHGPACSGIGKMVDFDLPAGRAIIELSAATTPEIEIMVTAVP